MTGSQPSIDTVRHMFAIYSNWGRWGPEDQRGTLNHLTVDARVQAAQLVRTGEVFSLSLPLDGDGPQHATSGRFNPIHLMTVTGRDFTSPGSAERDADRRYLQNSDDVIIMPTQTGTQWDGLAHVFFEQQMYNGFSAAQVSSDGARRNAITGAAAEMVGRGILVDLVAANGGRPLDAGVPVTDRDLRAWYDRVGLEARPGDFVLIRTGAILRARERGTWDDYAGGSAPGLGLESVDWLARHEVTAVATDTWDVEVRPSQTPDVAQPMHILLIVGMGMWVGEMFDLEQLAQVCAERESYEFFFTAPPLVISKGIGSPINPMVVL